MSYTPPPIEFEERNIRPIMAMIILSMLLYIMYLNFLFFTGKPLCGQVPICNQSEP